MLQLPALLARLARRRSLSLLLATLATGASLGLAATPAAAQTAPPVYTTSVYLSYYAPATATGEAVLFTGTGKISSRVSRDADTGTTSLVAGSTRVSVQLNLATWVGRTGRIYMTLPRTPGPTVRATWRTGGTLLPGTVISGDRTLVYAGPVTSPVLRDLIDIALEADGARLTQPEALAFGFEIELDQ